MNFVLGEFLAFLDALRKICGALAGVEWQQLAQTARENSLQLYHIKGVRFRRRQCRLLFVQKRHLLFVNFYSKLVYLY